MSSSQSNPRRPLNSGEAFVLAQIQDIYGPQNSEDRVFFSDRDESVLFVIDKNGVQVLAAVLTNLSNWISDGTIESVAELRKRWLRQS